VTLDVPPRRGWRAPGRLTRAIALYVSGHGFGHAVRSAEVARALLARGARVLLRTDAPLWLFPSEVEALAAVEGAPVDVGVAQNGGLDLDIDETRRRWGCFARAFNELAWREATVLRDSRVDLVLGDIPPLAFAAAHAAGIPSYALANFGWDWIYAAWPGFEQFVARVQHAYGQADGLLRLPLHSPAPDAFPAFRQIVDVPLIARRAARPGSDVRAELDVAPAARLVLLSFGGFQAQGLTVEALADWPDYLFVVSTDEAGLPPNVRRLPERQLDYPSLLAACDAIVTKPGYGIAADCLANRVPVLYTDRGPFREYEVLAHALETLGQARYAPHADVLAGQLGPHLDALLTQSTAWADVAIDGAERVADLLLNLP
jgi:UDP:flavonoid glycosyltransferase YjiC (YdhE family)